MNNWSSTLVSPHSTFRECLACLDAAGSQILLVVDKDRRLIGTISDGDARRGLLNGASLNDKASSIMHLNPIVALDVEDNSSLLAKMRLHSLSHLPIINNRGCTNLFTLNDFLSVPKRINPVVIMAGGLGTRLGSLTVDTPKPMLPVGSKPLLQTIIERYRDFGFSKFFLSVNYKADVIVDYFGDGKDFSVEISYLRETKRLGTAGALSLLPRGITKDIVVTNADLLTNENIGNVVDLHEKSKADATLCVREYDYQIPFGVVNLSNGFVSSISESQL